jgi:hypothetical protein
MAADAELDAMGTAVVGFEAVPRPVAAGTGARSGTSFPPPDAHADSKTKVKTNRPSARKITRDVCLLDISAAVPELEPLE